MNQFGKMQWIRMPLAWLLQALLLLSLAHPALAQVTSANLRGTVLDPDGKPVAGATVLLDFPAAQVHKQTTTSENGQFAFTGLRVGGPYNLKATKEGVRDAKRDGLQLIAGNNEAEVLNLSKSEETVKVTGARQVTTSAKSTFFASDITNAPSARQDIKDIVRRAPDVIVDNNQLRVAGSNNRYNSITVDGMRQDDSFGLNLGGYPTNRSPISLQSVQEIAVERSPFDVRYGNFLGAGINVQTKSGTDDFAGSVYVTHASKKLASNKKTPEGAPFISAFEENHVGFALGGPIIKEKLHFFTNIETMTTTTPSIWGPYGSGAPNQASTITVDEVEQVKEIAGRVYGFNAGDASKTQKEKDFKGLLKLDYTINDAHRVELKYQKSQGTMINTGTTANNGRLPLTSYWYEKKDQLDNTSARLFSDWSSELSTKFEISTKTVKTTQDPLNGNGFMDAEVKSGAGGQIMLGPDRARHTNDLENTSNIFGGEANYLMDKHLLTGGVQVENVKVRNLFLLGSNGIAQYKTIADFENKKPSQLQYFNAVTLDPSDAEARWGYGISTLMLQDEWQFSPSLMARFGLRAEVYDADGGIESNQKFIDRYGFSNTETISGKQVLLPRLALAYKVDPKLNVRGGFGLFGGGTPSVWVSNTYSNDGVTISNTTNTDPAVLSGFDGRNIPQAVKDKITAGDGNVDALDPSFKIPQSYKFQTGFDYKFDIVPEILNDIVLDVNYTYTKTRYGVLWRDLRRDNTSFANNVPTAVAPDGRAIYDTTPTDAKDAGSFSRGYDLLLTNTDKGYSNTASLSLTKQWDSGVNVSTSYAWQDVQEVSPGISSTSQSNYSNVPIQLDPNNPGLNRSVFETKHRFLVTTGYDTSFWNDLTSNLSFIYELRSGQPYSYVMGGSTSNLNRMYGEGAPNAARMLFYVPKGDGSDVEYDPAFDQDSFNAFLSKYKLDKYRGQIAPRNAFFSEWVQKLDLRMSQQLPGFGATDKAKIVLDIENFPNLLNKKWGQVKQSPFPYMYQVVDVDYNKTTGKYIYKKNLHSRSPMELRPLESIWRLQIAASYDF